MSFLDDMIAACVALTLCPDPADDVALPGDDGALYTYQQPEEPIEKPPPKAEMPPAFEPLVIEKTFYVQQSAAQPDLPAEPKLNPRIVAYNALLGLRRETAFSGGLGKHRHVVQKQEMTQDLDDFGDGLPVSSPPNLDFGFARQPDDINRYDHGGLESGLPIDNSRIVRSDRYINAVFEGSVNSQLATGGEVVLQVSEHVYGYHGRNILIPRGSRMECSYEVPAHANSTRLEFQCDRILLADSAVEIYQLQSKLYDFQGNLGVSGQIDRRFWDRYGEAIIITGLSTAVKMAAGSIKSTNNKNLATSINAGAEELSQRFGEITASILENQFNTRPIIRIAQGTPVIIKPGNDWYIAHPRKGLNNASPSSG